MVYYIKAIDVDSLFVESKSNNKKHFNNENLGSHIVSYDDFLTEIFFHNEYNMISNVIFDKGILEIDYIDFKEENYDNYKNTFKFVGSAEEANCMIKYLKFLEEIRNIVKYYDKTKEERITTIEDKKREIDNNKELKNKAIDYSYSYTMNEEMDLFSKEETKTICDYIANNKNEVVREVTKDTKGSSIDKFQNLFILGIVGSAYAGLYALNNPVIGSQVAACGAFVSFSGLALTKQAKHEDIEYKINELLSELKNIYGLNKDYDVIRDKVLRQINNDLNYINNHKDYDLDVIITRIEELKNRYIEDLKDKFQTGNEMNTKDYFKELSKIELDMYDITCIYNIDVDDMYITMAYEEIKNIMNNPYPDSEKDINYIKYLIWNYLEASLKDSNSDYQHAFINKLIDLQIDIECKRTDYMKDSINMVK